MTYLYTEFGTNRYMINGLFSIGHVGVGYFLVWLWLRGYPHFFAPGRHIDYDADTALLDGA